MRSTGKYFDGISTGQQQHDLGISGFLRHSIARSHIKSGHRPIEGFKRIGAYPKIKYIATANRLYIKFMKIESLQNLIAKWTVPIFDSSSVAEGI